MEVAGIKIKCLDLRNYDNFGDIAVSFAAEAVIKQNNIESLRLSKQ